MAPQGGSKAAGMVFHEVKKAELVLRDQWCVEANSVSDHAQMRAMVEANKARPRPKNSPPDCFLNGLSVVTTFFLSGSIVIETLVID